MRERAARAGVPSVDVRQRHGELAATLAEQKSSVALIVLGRRGEAAEHRPHDIGRNLEHVVRVLHKPTLTVTADFQEPQRRVLIAFDGGIVTCRGVELVATSPLFHGLPVHLLMSDKESSEAAKQLEWATATLSAAGFTAEASLIPGDADKVIARTVREQAIDLLIMRAYSHSPLRSLLFGSNTTDLLRSATIPTLLLR